MSPDIHSDDAVLAPAQWRVLGGNFGDAIKVLRFEEPLDTLEGGQWIVLLLAVQALTSGDPCVSQTELAVGSGLSVRTVRRRLIELEELGLLAAARDNGTVMELGIGPRLAPILREFTFCRDPKLWRWRSPRLHVVSNTGTTPDTVAGVDAQTPDTVAGVIGQTPDRVAGVRSRSRYAGPTEPTPFAASIPRNLQRIRIDDSAPLSSVPTANSVLATPDADPGQPLLRNKNKEDLHSFSSEGGTPDTVAGVVDPQTLRRLALDALALRFQRANPGIPLPRTCDAGDVRLVEACTSKGTWTVETLRQAHLDAIDGAFDKAPPDRPPTPMYIWGQFRFFLENARLGRAKRIKAQAPVSQKKPKPQPEDPPASSEWLEEHMRQARARLATIPDISLPRPRARFGEEPT